MLGKDTLMTIAMTLTTIVIQKAATQKHIDHREEQSKKIFPELCGEVKQVPCLFQASLVEHGWDYEAIDEYGHVYRKLAGTDQETVMVAMGNFLEGTDRV